MKNFGRSIQLKSRSKIAALIPSILFVFSSLFVASNVYSQKSKDKLKTTIECVKYIGNDTYVATYGYENLTKKDIVVAEDNSVVIYNNGQSKKRVINTFKSGYHSKAFTQTFKTSDHCIWRVILPNGEEKITTADNNSNHCRIDDSDIEPLFDGAVEGGVLWPELYWLAQQETVGSNDIFQIDNSVSGDETVLIEIVAFENVDLNGLRNDIAGYGFTNEIPNGNNPLVLTGFFPIADLEIFNQEPLSLSVNFVRPIITPGLNGEWIYSGLVGTQQDLAMRANLVREAYDIDGAGTTICVISDSYGDPSTGIGSGDLPGVSNMEVLSDLSSIGPFTGSDEGRAMVELIYDIAPGANYKFWTGTASPGYMAYGITQFVTEGCDIGVDDVTHLMEPFLPIGQISQAVEYAKDHGMHYVTSAGNFDNRGFRGNFTNAAIPANFGDFTGTLESAHDFGGGIMKGVSVVPGIYIIVLQWDDKFWAQGQTPGSDHDLNFWMVDDEGHFKYFGNRDNNGDEFDPTGEDPIEILGFNVLNPTTLNVMITGANIPEGLPFEYIVFKAPDNGWELVDPVNSFNATTVVGHAASPHANSVGAAFYGFTPEFENQANMLEPFSSKGGLDLLGNTLNKPDYVAPDGGNNTFFGQVLNYDNDAFPNFFGTSAAAPAAAAGMAILLEASDKFYNLSEGPLKNEFTPAAMKGLLQATAVDIDATGSDLNSGAGLVQLDQTLLSLANPSPQILELILEEGKTPGLEPFTLTIIMQYPVVDKNGAPILGEGGTEIKFREEVLPLTEDNWDWATNGENEYIINYYVDIGTFIGNPPITVTNPSKADVENPIDGGSETMNILNIQKKDLLVKAGDATKLFGESIPTDDFSYKVYEVDQTNPDPASWSEYSLSPQEKIALDAVITYSAEFTDLDETTKPVTFLTEFGKHTIKIPTPDPIPVGLTEIYNFIGFGDDNIGHGTLTIDPLPVTVTPDDQTVEYGEKLDITLTYDFMTPNIPDSAAVAQYIINSHNDLLATDYFAIANRGLALVDEGTTSLENRGLALVDRGLALVDRGLALVDGSSWMLTEGVIGNRGLALVDGANNVYDIGIDVAAEFILEDPTVAYNRGLALVDRGLALVDGQTLFESGDVGVPFIDNRGLALVDRGLALVDRGLALVDEEGDPVDKEFKLFFIVSDEDTNVDSIKSVHFVTGLDVLPNGFNHYIASGALLNPSLNVTNQLGELHITPRTVKVTVDETDPASLTKVFGAADPVFPPPVIVEGALVPGDVFTGTFGRATGENAGSYAIDLGTLAAGNAEDPVDHAYFGLNYNLELMGDPEFTISQALLTVTSNPQIKEYGNPVVFAEPSITYTGWKGTDGIDDLDTAPVISTTVDESTNTGIHLGAITASGGVDSNYEFIYVPGDFTITEATLIATANNQTKEYGEPVVFAEPTISYSGWKGADGVDNLDVIPIISTIVDESTNAGAHPGTITISGGSDDNYIFIYFDGDFTITQATLEATASNQTKVYGDVVVFDDPSISYSGWKVTDGIADLDVTPIVSTTVDESTTAGNHPGTISVSSGSDGNYVFSYVTGDFTVTQATLVATANNQTKVYGDPVVFDEPSISYSGWKVTDGIGDLDVTPIVSTTVDESTASGNHPGSISVSSGSDGNYVFSYVTGDFTVTQATLVATANNQTKVYGVINPELTITYSGFRGTDSESVIDDAPDINTTATQYSDVGPYAITLTGGSDNNYALTLNNNILEITQASLTATADPKTKVYGVINPELTITYSGFRGTDSESVIDDAPDINTTATQYSDVGPYAITLAGGSDNNYALTLNNNILEITQASLTATADPKAKVYGVINPELTITYSGFRGTDSESVIDDAPDINTTATQYSDVGPYAINLTGGSDNNYALTLNNNILEITQASLTVTANNQTKVYGDPVVFNEPRIYYSGWEGADGVSDLDVIPTISTSVDESYYAGNYTGTITVSGGSDNNYSFSYIDGDFAVEKARLEVTILSPDYALKEGDPFPTSLSFEYGYCNSEYGLRNTDYLGLNSSDVYTLPAYTGAPGEYTIKLNAINAMNYEVVQAGCGDPGQFYVNPFGPATPNVHPRLDCIEATPEGSTYPYIAHLYYENPNATTIYVPKGVNNRIYYVSSAGNMEIEGGLPTLFYPGTHSFDVYFDGSKLIWELKSDNTLLKEAVSSDASVGSNRCSDSGARVSSSEVERSSELSFDIETISGYPNPTTDMYFVNLNDDLITQVKFSLVDMNGRIQDVQITRNQSRRRLEINLRNINSGLYLLKLDYYDENKIIKVIKQ